MLLDITWTADPVIFSIGPKEIRWYTLMFLVGFAVGYKIVERMFRREGLNEKWLDPLLYFTLAGTLIGARLGHCIFYNPSYYFSHPVEILKVWEGGLASHGGVLGIIIAIYFFSRYVSHRSMLWTFDKLVVPTGLVAALIKLDDAGAHLAGRGRTRVSRSFGRAVVSSAPALFTGLGIVGTVAMLWVGGHILATNLAEVGLDPLHHAIEWAEALSSSPVLSWIAGTAVSCLIGTAVGTALALARHGIELAVHRRSST